MIHFECGRADKESVVEKTLHMSRKIIQQFSAQNSNQNHSNGRGICFDGAGVEPHYLLSIQVANNLVDGSFCFDYG